MNIVKIPMKTIVEKLLEYYDCEYEVYEVNLISRYFIACLNLGYAVPEDLEYVVSKLAKKVKKIEHSLSERNGLEYYKLDGDTLYVPDYLILYDNELYDKTIFKAITEAVLGFDDELACVSNAFLEIMAEKVFNMDVNDSRIIMPKTERYIVGDEVLTLRAGYENHKLTINLLKQLFICKNINENLLFRNMLSGSFKEEWEKLLEDKQVKSLLKMLNTIALMDMERCITEVVNQRELEYIETYQMLINNMFTQLNHNYLAFSALITTNDLRNKCVRKFNHNEPSDM